MAARALCSVSIDLDPLDCYYGIHGLGAPPEQLAEVVLRRGLPRFLEVFARRGMAATFFVVGRDLDAEAGRLIVREAARAGHELGNHSYSHFYDLHERTREEMGVEVDRAHALIAEVGGAPPVGFRAPGYNLSPALLDAVIARGYRYDSSVLPAPPYMGAKALVMAGMRLVGRTSGSALADPRLSLAPTTPYRPDARRPWRRGQASLSTTVARCTPSASCSAGWSA